MAFNKVSILVVLAIEGRPPIVETVGLTIVLEVAAVVGGVGAGALMAEGVAFDVVKAAAVVAAAMGSKATGRCRTEKLRW